MYFQLNIANESNETINGKLNKCYQEIFSEHVVKLDKRQWKHNMILY